KARSMPARRLAAPHVVNRAEQTRILPLLAKLPVHQGERQIVHDAITLAGAVPMEEGIEAITVPRTAAARVELLSADLVKPRTFCVDVRVLVQQRSGSRDKGRAVGSYPSEDRVGKRLEAGAGASASRPTTSPRSHDHIDAAGGEIHIIVQGQVDREGA